MYEVLSQLCFRKPILKFSVQTFYQLLFSIFPLAFFPFSLYRFPFNNSFTLPKASHIKKAQSKAPKGKSQKQKAKAPLPPPGVFYGSKQGRATGGRDIATGET
jgi:hypothetical protein